MTFRQKMAPNSKSKKSLYLLLMTLFMASCAKSIYIQTDSLGTSKFILYKNNYKYIENTSFTHFVMSGKYEISDSSIVFECREKGKLPYNYLGHSVEIKHTNQNSEFTTLQIIDKQSNEPLILTSISARNKSNQIIDIVESNFDGFALLRKNHEITLIEIEYVGYAKQLVDCHHFNGHDLLIRLEPLRSNSRMSSAGCLTYFPDVLLEYKIDAPSNIQSFERNGTVFRKE